MGEEGRSFHSAQGNYSIAQTGAILIGQLSQTPDQYRDQALAVPYWHTYSIVWSIINTDVRLHSITVML
jgi:hypothetical protein